MPPMASNTRRVRRVFGSVLTILAAVLVLLAAACLICRYLDTAFKPVILAALLVPYATPAALAGVAAFAFRRLWLGSLIGGAVCLALLIPQVPILLADPAPAPARDTLRILDVNMALGTADATQIVDLVRSRQIDVLTLQEFPAAAAHRLDAAGLSTVLPFSYVMTGEEGGGAGIYSRYKMIDQRTYRGFPPRLLSAAVGMPSGAVVTVYSLHVWSLWRNSSEWRRGARKLTGILAEQPGCVVAAGDYDASIDHAPLRDLMSQGNVEDAGSHTGNLYLPTYRANSWWPALAAIDHALYRGARAVSTSTHKIHRADHRALAATFDTSACH